MKTCIKCGEEKELDHFYFRSDRNKHRNECKICTNTRAAQDYRNGKDSRRVASYRYVLRTTYGLSTEQYDAMHKEQRGRCKICDEQKKLVVDHCHDSGKVRGLLCGTCNTGIGGLKDSPMLLKKALVYLESSHT